MAVYNPGAGFIEVSSGFGDPREQNGIKRLGGHEGIDWAADLGTPIPAAADGEVILTPWDKNGYGHYIVLKHTDQQNKQVLTIYGQMRQKSTLALNTLVKKGDIVGYVGMTGESSRGSHLHFEIRLGDFYDRKIVDPSTYDLSQLKSLEEPAQSSPAANSDDQINPNQQTNGNDQADTTANTAQDEQDINSYATPTACTEDQFIVQIMGKDHPEAQRVILVDDKNNVIEPDNKNDVIDRSKLSLLSTLHTWDWCKLQDKKDKLKAYLEIKTSAKPIRILLSEQIKKTERQTDKQHNQIVPIVPITLVDRLADFNRQSAYEPEFISGLGAPVVTRTGFLYIFKGHILQREIQIIEKDKNTLAFKDVPIEQYRKANLYQEGKRTATGVELSEIWLPACWNEIDIQNTSFMYSEVQLSAARLNLFAIDDNTFSKHPKTTLKKLSVENTEQNNFEEKMAKGQELLKNFSNRIIYDTKRANTAATTKADTTIKIIRQNVISANFIAPHRMRDVIQEITLDNPAKYLYDQEQTYFKDAKALAKEFEDENEQGKASFYQIKGNYSELNRKIRDLEFGAWTHLVETRKQNIQKMLDFVKPVGALLNKYTKEGLPVLSKEEAAEAESQAATFTILQSIKSPINALLKDIVDVISNKGEPELSQTPPDMWSNMPTFNNVLQDAQDREIYCLYIDDIIYRNRQLTTNLTNTTEQLRSVVDQAARHSYFDSALIIQQIIAPETLGGQPNDLRKTLRDNLDKKGKEKLAVACSAIGRAALVTKYSELQAKLCQQFKSTELLETLADHLSQDNELHYTAAYINTLRSLLSFALPMSQIDPYLSPDGKVYYGVDKIAEATNQQQGLEFITALVETLDSHLHKMLFKPLDLETVGKPLTTADKNRTTANFGNGYIRPNILHKCLNEKKQATEEDTENLDAALIVLEFEQPANDKVKNIINLGKDLAGVVSSALSNIKALVDHWSAKEKAEVDNNTAIRTNIQNIENEMNRLSQQAEEIEKARQDIANQKKAPIFNETIAVAEEISQRAEEAMRINQQTKAEIASKLPQIQEDADKARQIQGLEQNQQQNQQKITTLNQEINTLEQRQQQAIQAKQDQATINEYDKQIAAKQAELNELNKQTPSQTASKQGNAHIDNALGNNSNNGQARVGTVSLHELPIKLWRLVMFDHTRHVLGGLISEAYIAPFEQRVQGAGSNPKGILIRFPETPEAKTVLREIYGDVIDTDYNKIASTNRDNVGRQNPVNTRKNFLAIFAPEGSELHNFIKELELETLANRTEEFANASNAKRVEIAESYRNRAQTELEGRQNRQQTLQSEISTLENNQQALQNNVDKIKDEYGQLLDDGATEQQIQQKREQLAKAEQSQKANANNIAKLRADLGLEGTYQDALRTLIDTEQATINKLRSLDSANQGMQQTKDQADQTAANERARIETERKQQLAQAQAELDNKIAQHSVECDRLQQQKPNYATLRDNLTSSERAIINAREEVATNSINKNRLGRLVDNQGFRSAVLAFQVYNLYNAFDSFDQMARERGDVYKWSTIGSAAGNLALAVEDIIAHSTKQNINALTKGFRSRVLYEIPEKVFPKILSGSSKVVLTLKVTGIVLAQAALSVVAIGLTAVDLWYSINQGDKGIIIAAKGLALLGSIAGLASVFIGGATFLLLNPLGWAALFITLAAFAIIKIFSKAPLEAWLQYGPFSASPKAYLRNETEAFYRLVGIYSDIQISIENNPNIIRNDVRNHEHIEIPYKHSGVSKIIRYIKIKAAKRIRITSQLNGLMASGKDTIIYNTHFRLKPQGDSFLKEVSDKIHNNLTIIENDLPNGKEYIIDDIESVQDCHADTMAYLTSYPCQWQVASQILVNYGGKALAFPALRANNDESYDYTQAVQAPYNKAVFDLGKPQVFWANETTHRAEPGKTAAAPKPTETAAAQTILSVNASLA